MTSFVAIDPFLASARLSLDRAGSADLIELSRLSFDIPGSPAGGSGTSPGREAVMEMGRKVSSSPEHVLSDGERG
jgi:hypothetical protein